MHARSEHRLAASTRHTILVLFVRWRFLQRLSCAWCRSSTRAAPASAKSSHLPPARRAALRDVSAEPAESAKEGRRMGLSAKFGDGAIWQFQNMCQT